MLGLAWSVTWSSKRCKCIFATQGVLLDNFWCLSAPQHRDWSLTKFGDGGVRTAARSPGARSTHVLCALFAIFYRLPPTIAASYAVRSILKQGGGSLTKCWDAYWHTGACGYACKRGACVELLAILDTTHAAGPNVPRKDLLSEPRAHLTFRA